MSRESLLLANNVLLVVAAASVLLGTLYPLVIDALGLGKLSVGPPYFNAVFVPLMVPLLFLVATGPIARWKEASARAIARRLAVPAAVAVAAGIAVPFALGGWQPLPALGVALAAWVACCDRSQHPRADRGSRARASRARGTGCTSRTSAWRSA